MSKKQKYLLAVSSGLLLWLAWPPLPFFPLLFVAFVPILWLEDTCSSSPRSARSFFGFSYLALLIWNIFTTWWVGATVLGTKDISTAIAGLLANTANPLLMCIPLLGFHRTKKQLGENWGYLALICYWLTFEFIHLRWDLSWPWLTLGNGFSAFPWVIQWYEFTGVPGGTLWILLANIFIYKLLKKAGIVATGQGMPSAPVFRVKDLIPSVSLLLLPVFFSLILYYSYREKGKPQEVVVIQPNVDPYAEKFDPAMFELNLQKIIQLSLDSSDSETDYVVWPETSIQDGILINDLSEEKVMQRIRSAFHSYPKLKIVCGINSYATYQTPQTRTSRYSEAGHFYWDAFNTAIQIDSSSTIPYYHKSKLVPGVEQMPYPEIFKFVEALALQMGGTTGSLGTQDHRAVFHSADSVNAAPMICYESIYGEYATEYVREGGNLLFVITNDGWWGNTAGYKQHIEYARLRAVESRRDVAQSANTGTSAFINQRGDISHETPWWQPAVIKSVMHANDELTFYVKYGDYIGRGAIVVTILLACFAFVQRFRKKKTEVSVPS